MVDVGKKDGSQCCVCLFFYPLSSLKTLWPKETKESICIVGNVKLMERGQPRCWGQPLPLSTAIRVSIGRLYPKQAARKIGFFMACLFWGGWWWSSCFGVILICFMLTEQFRSGLTSESGIKTFFRPCPSSFFPPLDTSCSCQLFNKPFLVFPEQEGCVGTTPFSLVGNVMILKSGFVLKWKNTQTSTIFFFPPPKVSCKSQSE